MPHQRPEMHRAPPTQTRLTSHILLPGACSAAKACILIHLCLLPHCQPNEDVPGPPEPQKRRSLAPLGWAVPKYSHEKQKQNETQTQSLYCLKPLKSEVFITVVSYTDSDQTALPASGFSEAVSIFFDSGLFKEHPYLPQSAASNSWVDIGTPPPFQGCALGAPELLGWVDQDYGAWSPICQRT